MAQNDIVVDANVMALFGSRAGGVHESLFTWLGCCGGLCVSNSLLNEYGRQHSIFVSALIAKITREGRLSKIKNSTIDRFYKDKNYAYTCNHEDILIARTVFRSFRKLLVSNDLRLRNDINGFSRINGVSPRAVAVVGRDDLMPPAAGCPATKH